MAGELEDFAESQRRALPMPPTAQEMASELHAWRGASARSRSTVKGGAAGPGSPSPCGHGPLPGSAGYLGKREIVVAGLVETAEPEGHSMLPNTGKHRGGPFVWRCVLVPKPPLLLESRADARALILHQSRSKPARFGGALPAAS